MSGETRWSRVTVRGYTFNTRIENDRVVVLVDPQRADKEVMRAPLPEEARRYAAALDLYQKKLARLVLDHYEGQHKASHHGLEFLEGARLSSLEIKKRLGYPMGKLEQSLEGAFRGAAKRGAERPKE